MPKFKVLIVQSLRVERECIVEIEADDMESAVCQQSDSDEAPGYDEPVWVSYPNLIDEKVSAASPEDTTRIGLALKDEATLLAHFAKAAS